MKLEVVDEAEDRASALRVKIVPGLLDDLGARELRHGLPGGLPGLGGRDGEPERGPGGFGRRVARAQFEDGRSEACPETPRFAGRLPAQKRR
jgi:hypothetical protein